MRLVLEKHRKVEEGKLEKSTGEEEQRTKLKKLGDSEDYRSRDKRKET